MNKMKFIITKIFQKYFYISTFLLFIGSGLLIYSSSLNNSFVMDDEIQIIGNLHIQSLSELPSFFTSSTMDSGGAVKMGGIYYKPLMTSFYALVWHFFGNDPFAFHLPLLIIHILSSYLVFLFSMSFLPRSYSLFLGLLFLLHPVNSEVVLYIADTQDIFYFFFGIMTLYLIEHIENKKLLFSSLLILFSCGLLSKETGGLFLLFAASYAFFIRPYKKPTVFCAAGIVGISYLVLRWQIGLTSTKSEALLFHSASFLERLRMIPLILGHYIEIFFLPMRLSLATDFVLNEYSWNLFWAPLLLLSFFLCVLFKITRTLFASKYKSQAQFFISVLLGWFFLHGQLLVPLDGVYADRWFYIGTWGLSSILILYLHLNQKIHTKKFYIVFSIILVCLGIRSFARSLDWQEPLNLYRREVELHPWDAIMVNNVGVELFRHQKIMEAEPYFKKATQLNPKWNVAWNNLGAFYEQQFNYTLALELYLKSLTVAPYPLAYENYAKLLMRMGEKEKVYLFLKEQALPLYPHNPILIQLWNWARE